MQIIKGGTKYGFCPAKALSDYKSLELFKVLVISAETGQLYTSNCIVNELYWFVDLASWFLPRYNELRFMQRAKMILGDSKNGDK